MDLTIVEVELGFIIANAKQMCDATCVVSVVPESKQVLIRIDVPHNLVEIPPATPIQHMPDAGWPIPILR